MDQVDHQLEELMTDLQDTDADKRLSVIRTLGQRGDRAAVAPLSDQLNDPDPRVRMRVIVALGQLADDQAVRPLSLRLTNDDEPDVRARAARALGQIGSPLAIDALSQALKDDNAEVRRRAVQALNQINDAMSRESLIQALTDPDRDVRRLAARALGNIGDPVALESLRELCHDSNVVVQDEVTRAIGAIQDRQALRAQRHKVDELRRQRDQTDQHDAMAQVRVESQIAREQLTTHWLEARVAAHAVSPEEETEHDRERQSVIYELQRLVRELESLSTSVRTLRMREAWEIEHNEAEKLQTAWKDPQQVYSLEDMRSDLQRLRQRKETLFNAQNKALIEMSSLQREAFSAKLQIEQSYDALSDPSHRTKVENWHRAVEAQYEFLKMTYEQGDLPATQQHHASIIELRDHAEEVRNDEARAKRSAGNAVICFVLIGIIVLPVILYILAKAGLANRRIPALQVPFSVVIWSAIGAIAAMLYQFLNRPVSQLETFKWLIARPMQGVIMGSFLYLVVAGGLLVIGSQVQDGIRPELGAVIAFLGGFSDRFSEEMVKRATSILSRESSERPKTPPKSDPSSNRPTAA